MKLYSFTIRGQKYYAVGSLSQEAVEEIEKTCMQESNKTDGNSPCESFVKLVSMSDSIIPIEVNHIFSNKLFLIY